MVSDCLLFIGKRWFLALVHLQFAWFLSVLWFWIYNIKNNSFVREFEFLQGLSVDQYEPEDLFNECAISDSGHTLCYVRNLYFGLDTPRKTEFLNRLTRKIRFKVWQLVLRPVPFYIISIHSVNIEWYLQCIPTILLHVFFNNSESTKNNFFFDEIKL